MVRSYAYINIYREECNFKFLDLGLEKSVKFKDLHSMPSKFIFSSSFWGFDKAERLILFKRWLGMYFLDLTSFLCCKT